MPVSPQGKSAVQLDQELRRQKEALTKQSNLALRNSLITGILGETAKTAGVEFVQRTMEEKMPTAEESLMATRRDYAADEADWLGLGRAEEDERDRERIAGYRRTGDPYAVVGWLSPEDRQVFDKQEELYGQVRAKGRRVSELQKKITKIGWQLDEMIEGGDTGSEEYRRLYDQKRALEEVDLADAKGKYETIQGMVETGKIPEKRAELLNRAIEKREKLAAEKAKRRGQRFRMPRSGEQIQTPLGQRGKSRPPARRGGGTRTPQGTIPPAMRARLDTAARAHKADPNPQTRAAAESAFAEVHEFVKSRGLPYFGSSARKYYSKHLPLWGKGEGIGATTAELADEREVGEKGVRVEDYPRYMALADVFGSRNGEIEPSEPAALMAYQLGMSQHEFRSRYQSQKMNIAVTQLKKDLLDSGWPADQVDDQVEMFRDAYASALAKRKSEVPDLGLYAELMGG